MTRNKNLWWNTMHPKTCIFSMCGRIFRLCKSKWMSKFIFSKAKSLCQLLMASNNSVKDDATTETDGAYVLLWNNNFKPNGRWPPFCASCTKPRGFTILDSATLWLPGQFHQEHHWMHERYRYQACTLPASTHQRYREQWEGRGRYEVFTGRSTKSRMCVPRGRETQG